MYIENKLINKYISYWLISIFLIVSIMIVIGGLTRLTDSGLSITQWQIPALFLQQKTTKPTSNSPNRLN